MSNCEGVLMIQKIYRKIENGFLIALMAISTLVVCYAVFMRYIMDNPLIWSEELVCYFQVWIAFVGISCVARDESSFIRFDFLLHRMGPKLRKTVFFLEHIIMIAFLVLMVFVSTKWLFQTYSYGGISTPMKIPNYIPRIGVPLSFFLVLIHFAETLVSEVIDLCRKTEKGGDRNES